MFEIFSYHIRESFLNYNIHTIRAEISFHLSYMFILSYFRTYHVYYKTPQGILSFVFINFLISFSY